ncbi:response regulator transcription factor [Bradyrhizobium ontarionense]|uniref:Response regulator transcription factor n=1 Tax=Bradyrhizobium ontarionense TaxID=2898149 RepID=A0ABY3R716_9BRAD|nr:response regulator transcription factor [Bradyrhizobium sp. A19]UFZ02700.1 response regulator transcription factor [Bradyrhizobium sp. A19]
MRILVVDDHPLIVSGCKALIENNPEIELVDAADGKAGYSKYFSTSPDVAAIDINLPGISGFELCRRILLRDPKARIVILSMHSDPVFAARAIDVGAKGYISKNDDPARFVDAMYQVGRGAVYLSEEIACKLAFLKASGGSSPLRDLNSRELEILRLLGAGRTPAEVADTLDVSYKTIANNCTVLKKNLGARSLMDLARIALEHGLA